MAPRRETQAATQELPHLQFSDTISWKAGKPLNIQTLLKRLKALHEELEKLEQEQVEVSSLLDTAKELCSPNLIGHKDATVRSFVASCLADMLRLHAPDAPYNLNQLKVRSSS